MTYKIAIPQPITELGMEYLRERGYEIIEGTGLTDYDTLKQLLANADGLLARTADYPKEVLSAAKKLKVIGRFGVGTDNLDLEYCRQNGIWVAIAPEANSNAVAEHTIGLIMATARQFVQMDKLTRMGNWEARNANKGRDVSGKVLGLIGMGRIGSLVAQKAALGLSMKVIVYDPYLDLNKVPEYVSTVKSMDEILSQADFISTHLPATNETKNMVNKAFFSKMKNTAYFINCARGSIVDEGSLYWALSNKIIAGAACDVFQKEPASKENPLFSLDNIIVSPHNAALTFETMDSMGLEASMAIDNVLNNCEPKYPVVSHKYI
ncbi:hydroxypyruvate reductase [Clostridium homopropionicum DSM 5847]|uniref:Hydroxypyruvate reductase n=1 Tax=Clostridium homopropionicum DSM 5847 TaxID=1121318 RepID=A0A0L6Z9T3_9CLOT|nr:hydroxyacid dehydrogenase [Clostridium homopropionicum]KOA19720.1 hydroxypyruvate reductase [Clostridium homopropionicum DSM 5847]SFF79115.1 D-3-phosphoglycerate dehydrogenase [Clostridium homopropionicum]